MRRRDLILLGGFGAALVAAAVLGRTTAPTEGQRDLRPSTYLTGPRGASGLAETMQKLGVQVERWRRPLFGLSESVAPDSEVALVILHPAGGLSEAEEAEVVDWVRAGGRLVLAGRVGVEHRFGVAVRETGTNISWLQQKAMLVQSITHFWRNTDIDDYNFTG